ncbi:hypothetical protein Dalk_1486 [Desulfatibacillum aliphaticivorans]|uniref:Uncharacterized protein n=1 Tax=Desulfatibacillum aliphaticivorans TaxID=218208 RepID=B8FA90_DESAL|nr:hypothetical protein [Desulfatibacillum aliphaticivorans]ACL03186.1 hypothetical protein Dalk_1486 [Desulfatibacillum aliphaticivorans]
MTIEITVSVSLMEELYDDSNPLFLDWRGSGHLGPTVDLNAISFEARRQEYTDDLSIFTHACCKCVRQIFHDNGLSAYRFWLFAAHGPWQEKSRITKYKKFWKSGGEFESFAKLPNKSDEMEFESEKGLRYAVMVELDYGAFIQAADLMRNDSACCVIASRDKEMGSPKSVQKIFYSAFPEKKSGELSTAINWIALSEFLCDRESFLIRYIGFPEDMEATIDVIFKKGHFIFKDVSNEMVVEI